MPPEYDTTAEWRGRISAKVDEYGRRLNRHDDDIREIRLSANAAAIGLTRVEASVERLSGQIKEALAEQAKARSDEFAELQATVANNRLTPKERVMFILIPIVVVCISSLMLLLTTHTI
jgi:hypothetical protein